MATLTSVAYYTRKMVFYGAVGMVSLIILRIAWGIFSAWWVQTHPPPPPPPTVSFGVLPALKFPDGKDAKKLGLRLETISGKTPDLGLQANVYFMPAFRANVYGLELANALAARFGFTTVPERVDEQTYRWTKTVPIPATITVDLVTGHFSLVTQWRTDPEIPVARAPSDAAAIQAAKGYLRSANLLAADLDNGTTTIMYLKTGNDSFVPALSQSEANATQVHFFRSDIGKTPVVTTKPQQGLVRVIVSGASTQKQIIGIEYNYSPVESARLATYPLRSTDEAWKQLQAGQGYIPQAVEGASGTTVRRVELAYYDSETPQEFMQPVYVFTGDNGFIGYIQAVSSQWISQ